MHIKLGTDYITAKNDGGLQIMKITPTRKQPWIKGCKDLLPMLSIEMLSQWLAVSNNQVKRKKHSICHHPNTVANHSAQMFCEMLSQVYHKAIYNSILNIKK